MAGTQWPHPPQRSLQGEQIRAARLPHVDVTLPATGGTVRLRSASGGLEAVWIGLLDEDGRAVAWDRAQCEYRPAPVRLTPREARTLAAVLIAYADSHPSVGEEP